MRGRTRPLLGLAGVLVALLVLQQSPHDALLPAMADLGPIAGWRCAETSVYVYEPRHERGDASLLDEPPQATLEALYPEVNVERIEVQLDGGQVVAWTTVPAADGRRAPRVFVLAPGRLRAVSVNRDGRPVHVCDSHLGDWQVVGEHALG
jgi:hypothetical protein